MPVYGASQAARNVSRIKICVDSVANSEPTGRLISPYRKEAAAFSNILSMILLADEFFTKMKFPQAYNSDRSFEPSSAKQRAAQHSMEVTVCMDEEAFEAKLGEKATFVVQVQFRQNSSWQGTITWTEQKKIQRFRSTLEMIKLMDSALETGSDFPGWD